MATPKLVPPEQFLAIVEQTPLVSVDLICRDTRGQVLLGLRNNRPAQGSWFVPGGRICKDESVGAAIVRIAAKELGLQIADPTTARPLGVFQHFYDDNFAGAPGISTHYIVLAWELHIDTAAALAIDPQHSELRWFGVAELLASRQVHVNSKAYFDATIQAPRLP